MPASRRCALTESLLRPSLAATFSSVGIGVRMWPVSVHDAPKLLAFWVREQNHLLASGPMPARDDHGVAPPGRTDTTAIGGQTAARAQPDRPPGIGRTAPRRCGVLLAVESVWGRP